MLLPTRVSIKTAHTLNNNKLATPLTFVLLVIRALAYACRGGGGERAFQGHTCSRVS